MSKVRVSNFAISVDGFGAGARQSVDAPLGIGGEHLHEYFYPTRTFRAMTGEPGGTTGIDDGYAHRAAEGLGAEIMGRNMFGPVRGAWPDDSWKGWWGPEPPYHYPVFVLTHHARPPLEMAGGTTFFFVTDGIKSALDRAREAAGSKDIRIGGGAATVREYLRAGLVDELHIAIAPVALGQGEPLLAGLDLPGLGYHVSEHTAGEGALHVVFARGPSGR